MTIAVLRSKRLWQDEPVERRADITYQYEITLV
jgi:hypothetical protein